MTACANCGVVVYNDSNGKPLSKYYKQDMSKVFCGAQCSLDDHEKEKRLNIKVE